MRRISSIALCIAGAFAVTVGQAQTSGKSKPTARAAAQSQTEGTLLSLEDGWAKALVRRDVGYFRRMLAPGFVYTEDAAVMNAEDVIRASTGPDRVEWAGNEGMKVHDFGNTAVVIGILVIRGHGKDGPFNHRYRFTDTWQKRNGTWQIIAAQDYLIPK